MPTSLRRTVLVALGSVLVLLLTFLVAPPSNAASHSGTLRIKGPGSLYSGDQAWVAEAVGPGQVDQFELLVVNTGDTVAQYNLKVEGFAGPPKVDLYSGTLLLTPLAAGPDGYYTAPIAPGKTQALTLKITTPATQPADPFASAEVTLYATDGTQLANVTAFAVIKPPAHGTTPYEIYARNGSQPFVRDFQVASAPAIKVGGSTAFTVKLQNDGTSPAAVAGHLYRYLPGNGTFYPDYCDTLVVKDGNLDVTARFFAGTYTTPVLAVGASRSLTATFKRVIGDPTCAPFETAVVTAGAYGTPQSNTVLLDAPTAVP